MSSGGDGGGLGLVRGVTLAGLCTLLTAIGHVAGGGSLPDLALVAVLFPLLAGVLTTAARRCTSFAGAVLTLAAGQVALHQLLDALHPGHHDPGSAAVAGPAMVAMHVLATLATAVVVRGADRAVVAVADALRRIVPRRSPAPAVTAPLSAPVVVGPAVDLRLARARTAPVLRRGPPAAC